MLTSVPPLLASILRYSGQQLKKPVQVNAAYIEQTAHEMRESDIKLCHFLIWRLGLMMMLRMMMTKDCCSPVVFRVDSRSVEQQV